MHVADNRLVVMIGWGVGVVVLKNILLSKYYVFIDACRRALIDWRVRIRDSRFFAK
jgi:hypothetical protein